VKGGGGPPRSNRSKKLRAPRGGWTARRGVGGGTSRRTPRRHERGWVTSRGGAEESWSRAWGGGETGVCVWAHGEGWGQRASRGVCEPRDTDVGRAPRHAGVAWGRSSPGTDLDNPSGARIGGGWVAVVAGTRPGGRAGTPSSGVVAGRAGTPRHATRGLCGVRGSHCWKGRGPSDVNSTPTGGRPKISRSRPARE